MSEGEGSVWVWERVCRSTTGCGSEEVQMVKRMRGVREVRRVQET